MLGSTFLKMGSEYKPHDKYIIYNGNDKDLLPVVLRLPDPPPITSIDGYGETPAKQRWKRLEIPTRLQALDRMALDNVVEKYTNNNRETPNAYKHQKEFWRLMEERYKEYPEEIKFMKRIQWHLEYGYWFFCDGKPTWITPWHFRYLQFWYMPDVKGNYPQYRDTDRRLEIWAYYNRWTTETFESVDENGNALVGEDGKFHMKDVGFRTSYGPLNPKRRRRGDTQRGLNKLVQIAYSTRGANCTIVADTGAHAKDMFPEKLMPSLREEPVWIKPLWEGSYDTQRILCIPPGAIVVDDFLGSSITYTDTSTERANDSKKLHGLLSDEEGKGASRADVGSRWEINKLTMTQDDIHGYSEHPSTVEEMVEGSEYEEMWNKSNFYIRLPSNGQTRSGLMRIFIPAYDGLDGFVDYWGQSVIEKPTRRQKEYAPREKFSMFDMGARQFIEADLNQLLNSGRAADIKTYRERLRKTPLQSADMWIGTAGDLGFDYPKLDLRIAQLKRDKNATKRITLRWKDNIPFSTVEWEEDPNGKCHVSDLDLILEHQNEWCYGANVWNEKAQEVQIQKMPLVMSRFTAGADPFSYGNSGPVRKTNMTLSDGGLAIYWNYDPNLEESKNIREHDSGRFILDYQERTPSVDIYLEDVLMACIWTGAMLSFERNKDGGLWAYFVENGFGGYLKFQQNPDGTFQQKPGFYAGEGNKSQLFLKWRDFIDRRIHKEKHYNLCVDAREIKGYDDLGNKDRFAAAGWALMGTESAYGVGKDAQTKELEGVDFYAPIYEYR